MLSALLGSYLMLKGAFLFVYPSFLSVFTVKTTSTELYKQSPEIIIGCTCYTPKGIKASAFFSDSFVKHIFNQLLSRPPDSFFFLCRPLHFELAWSPVPREPSAGGTNNSTENSADNSSYIFGSHMISLRVY
ncbi:hypothetical protein SAMN05878295_10570 [Aeromonas hydrophila]|nr:hypothetical protein SAMN05880569_10570 [Aeromonas hydrophila]SIQ98945.1 hypothetical protein SAMN05878295_10570 [Aeromonas hydrophila]